jgi:predicted NUDIX family NTP pyrophosphohydrolase
MTKTCGIILLSKSKDSVLALHPTGAPPDVWSIPKGEIDHSAGENELQTALREFEEETGNNPHDVADVFTFIGAYVYRHKGKALIAYGAVQKRDFKNPIKCACTFETPDGRHVLECDDHAWLPLDRAVHILHETQSRALVDYMTKVFG